MSRRYTYRLVAFLFLAGLAPEASWGGVHAAISPTESQVDTEEEFSITFHVTEAGSEFNGAQFQLHFDSNLVTYMQSSQAGDYLLSTCGSSSVIVTDRGNYLDVTFGMLCPGTLATGPGNLVVLNFKAGTTDAVVPFTLQNVIFAAAGLSVPVDSAVDTTIQIGTPTNVGEIPQATVRIGVYPNPFNPVATIHLQASESIRRISIHDVRGRPVRTFVPVNWTGSHRLMWDGRDDRGSQLPSGAYYILAMTPTGVVSTRATLLK